MNTNIRTRESWLLILLFVLLFVLGGTILYLLQIPGMSRDSTPVIERITERQVYLESSASTSAVDKFTKAIVRVFPHSERGKWQEYSGQGPRDCLLDKKSCPQAGLLITSDGLLVFGGEMRTEERLLAADANGDSDDLQPAGNFQNFQIFRLFKEGELSLTPDQRTRFLNLSAVALADSRAPVAGQKILAWIGWLGESPLIDEGVLSGRTYTDEKVIMLNEILDTVVLRFADGITGRGRFYFNLEGQLLAMSNASGEEIDSNQIRALISRLSSDQLALETVDMGLSCLVMGRELAKTMNIDLDYGCLVADDFGDVGQAVGSGIRPGSLAEKMGLKAADVIMEVDKVSLLNRGLVEMMMEKTSGKETVFTVLRAGKTVDLKVMLK